MSLVRSFLLRPRISPVGRFTVLHKSPQACARSLIRQRLYSTSPPPPPRRKSWPFPLGLSLALLPGLYWFLSSSPPLSPQLYSTQTIASTAPLDPSHKLVSIAIPRSASHLFSSAYKRDGSPAAPGEIVVQHMMLGAPDIQIERPYTPINDPGEGQVDMVIKRVKGGEVGRLAHSLQIGNGVEVRGPIPTFSISPAEYDRIIMISTGTGIAPFLQLLSRMTPEKSSHGGPKLDLVHLQPGSGKEDWAVSGGMIPRLEAKFGERLAVHRPPPQLISGETIRSALKQSLDEKERIMVLVCLPPQLMLPLCGGLTRSLQQGPLTGTLAEIGLTADQVYKLE